MTSFELRPDDLVLFHTIRNREALVIVKSSFVNFVRRDGAGSASLATIPTELDRLFKRRTFIKLKSTFLMIAASKPNQPSSSGQLCLDKHLAVSGKTNLSYLSERVL